MKNEQSLQNTEIWMKSEQEMRMAMHDKIKVDKELMKMLNDLLEDAKK